MLETCSSDLLPVSVLPQLELKKTLLDRMVHLLSRGYVLPVVSYIRKCLEKLDTDLKNYKGNSIKESIRCWASLGRGGGQPGPNGPSTSIHSLPGLQARPR